jgi:hypothetical protein
MAMALSLQLQSALEGLRSCSRDASTALKNQIATA